MAAEKPSQGTVKSADRDHQQQSCSGLPVASMQHQHTSNACIAPPINHVTLCFTNEELEKAYMSSWCEKQLGLDSVGCCVSLMQLFAGIAYSVVRVPHMSFAGRVLMAGSGLLHGLHGVLISTKSCNYCQHRNTVIMGLLLLLRLLTAITVPLTPSDSSEATRLCYKTGIIPLCWYGISLILPFRLQIVAQLSAILLYQAALGVPACRELSADSHLSGLLDKVWSNFRGALALALQVQGLHLAPNSTPVEPLHHCWSTITLLLLLSGLILPAPAWYCMELRSRARFYKHWQQQQQQQWVQQQLTQGTLCNGRSTTRLTPPPAASARPAAASAAGAQEPGSSSVEVADASSMGFSGAVADDEGLGAAEDSAFSVPVVSLLMVVAVAVTSSSLMLMSYGPVLLQLQLQLL